jgi:predicted aconitase
MVVSPCMDNFRSIMVSSGKAFAYVPNMCGALARIGSIGECVEAATT